MNIVHCYKAVSFVPFRVDNPTAESVEILESTPYNAYHCRLLVRLEREKKKKKKEKNAEKTEKTERSHA